MTYRDDLNAAHQEIEKQRQEVVNLTETINKMKEKRNRKIKMRKVLEPLKIGAFVVLLIFGYVCVAGVVTGWTERNFCTKASPCQSSKGPVMSGIFWPVGVLVNLGKHSYDFVTGKDSGCYKTMR